MLVVDAELELIPLDFSETERLFHLTESNRDYLRRWLPWLDGVREPAGTRKFIALSKNQKEEGQGFHAGIWVKGELAGVIGHSNMSQVNRSVTLGYWLGAKYQARGIMTRACRAMIDHAFEELGLYRVEIRCSTGNHKSRAIPERLGFTREGVLRQVEWLYDHFEDHVVYGLLASEWKK